MYNKLTHSVAGLMTVLAGFYAVSGDFRSWIGELAAFYAAHVPHILQPVPALALALYMWYRNGLKNRGELNSQDAPVAASARGTGIGMTALALVLLVPFVSGCRHNVNNSNPKVVFASTLLAGSDCVKAVSTGLLAANDVVESLETTEPDYYAHVKPLLRNIAFANDKAIMALRAAESGDTAVDWQSAIVAVADAAGKGDLSAFGFKNPDSQKKARLGLASLTAALTAVTNSFRKQSQVPEMVPVYQADMGGGGLTDLLALLLMSLAKYGPGLFDAIKEAIKGNPQKQDETDEAYVARLNTAITSNLDTAAANDAKVEE